jgi:L-aspartate oxidase
VYEAPERLRELMRLGASFDRLPSGELMLGREGGHKANRIIHAQDATGLNISTALLEKAKTLPNILLLSHHIALDLITGDDGSGSSCKGAFVLDLLADRIEQYVAPFTVIATGGTGQLFRTTTNPLIATGDGIAMAIRAGARVSNMEFVQFHPTALYNPGTSPAFLVSEAVRGHGAYLRNAMGKRFMFEYHPDGELACRDVVSRAIASEMLAGDKPYVFLDCTHIPAGEIIRHFPNIYEKCRSKGLDITKEQIPVTPAAHYLCGGIDVDMNSMTSIKNLYACGECSNTGLHGANRLASNSLLEATVFAHDCFEDIQTRFEEMTAPEMSDSKLSVSDLPLTISEIAKMKGRVQDLMTHEAGIVRNTSGMTRALEELRRLQAQLGGDRDAFVLSAPWHELRNMITCAILILDQSILRKENRGGFFNRDLVVKEMV